jgi:hypothetical protein
MRFVMNGAMTKAPFSCNEGKGAAGFMVRKKPPGFAPARRIANPAGAEESAGWILS